MKTIIFRKPKFMRNESVMQTYIDVANAISKTIDDPKLELDQRYVLSKKMGECLNKAAKAGGFFRTKDFINWLDNKAAD